MLEAMESSMNGGVPQLQSYGDSSEEELSVLPRHTKVVVTGNNRTKSVLVGLQGVVKKAVGLGGWHWLVLTNGIEVKLQRNALSVIEAPTGNEEDNDLEFENLSWNGSDMVLEQSSQYKDPIFMLELVLPQQSTNGQTSSYFAWQKTVDAVKAFILHFQLKTFIFKRELAENPLIAISSNDSGIICSSNVSSASFGSNVSLESGIPCTIAFSNAKIRDVYVVPMVHKNTRKLLLTEKHPFRSRHGVVITIAPLAGLCPTIDKDHPSWLHLRVREFNPKLYATKAKGNHLSMPDHFVDGRWILGFPDAKACKDAHLAILREITKQRSAVEAILAPLLNYDLGLAEENREK